MVLKHRHTDTNTNTGVIAQKQGGYTRTQSWGKTRTDRNQQKPQSTTQTTLDYTRLHIQYRKEIKVDSKSTWKIMKKMSCSTYNIVYMLECQKSNCKQRYIGSTGRELKHRLADHRGYIQNQVTSRATGAHWNLPGHSLADLRVSVLEQCKKSLEEYRLERKNTL